MNLVFRQNMEAYSNIPALFDRYFYEQGREKFARVHRLECEEVLDNLGYVAVDRNNVYTGATDQELLGGISRFREEYQISSQTFPESFEYGGQNEAFTWFPEFYTQTREPVSESTGQLLSEEELTFLHRISSLEGEFDLHRFTLQQIGSNVILSRILNFRISILGIFDCLVAPQPDAQWPLYLEKLGGWCGVTSQNAVIELLGNAEKLSETLARQDAYSASRYHHFVYFKSSVQRLRKRMQQQTGDMERFRSRFPFIPTESIVRFEQTISDSNRIEEAVTDELNQLMTRLVQVRLQLLGTYPGKLDNDLGPLSLEGITSLMDYFRENFGRSKGFVLSDLLMHLGNDYWALNATYLFKAFLPVLDEMKEKKESKRQTCTISEEIGSLLSTPGTSPQAKESILATINEELQKESPVAVNPQRKPRTRAGKGLLRSIGRFFRHVGELTGKGIKRVIRILKKLFRWFKNTAQVIWRELKEIYSVMRQAITFFFSNRTITTTHGGQSIITDFDGGFDSITVLATGAALASESKFESGSKLKSGSELKSKPESEIKPGPVCGSGSEILSGSENKSGAEPKSGSKATSQSKSDLLIQAHIRTIETHSQALTQASAFAGTIISIALKVMTGPYGWIRLGVEVIRSLAGKAMS
ncbi:MAG: hypothetical protein AB2L20_25440 [Mangrovibacterium sp.]